MPGTEPVLLLWMLNVNAMFYRDIYFQTGKFKISDTVEPRLTATLVIQPLEGCALRKISGSPSGSQAFEL